MNRQETPMAGDTESAGSHYAYSGGYGGYYSVSYYGPYFLDAADQLSGPGSSAYERVHTTGGLYIHSQTGLYQSSYAYEGQNGSIYHHDVTSLGDIYNPNGNFYNPEHGGPITGIYNTNTSYYYADGSGNIVDHDSSTSYTTAGFGFNHGPVASTYSTYDSIKDTLDGDYIRNSYRHTTTYYTSGAMEVFDLNSYSQFQDGHTVAYSVFQTGYRSYIDPYGYATTSYIDTQHHAA